MTRLKVLETNILHASDVIIWLDGASADTPAEMLRIAVPLAVEFSTRPRDLQVVHGRGKTALLRRPVNEIIAGVATEEAKAAPLTPTYELTGLASDPVGRYIPRRFSIAAGSAAGHGLVVYPSPLGTRFGPAGGLSGTLRFAAGGAPAPWALLTLTVTTAVGAIFTFRCQASEHGDFLLPLHRLPPLPEGIADYAAELAISALAGARADTPLDPDDLVPMALGDLADAAIFSNSIKLRVAPGSIRLIRSAGRDHIAVQPH